MRITTILLAHSKSISQMDTHVVDTNTQKHKRNECVYIGYLVGIIFWQYCKWNWIAPESFQTQHIDAVLCRYKWLSPFLFFVCVRNAAIPTPRATQRLAHWAVGPGPYGPCTANLIGCRHLVLWVGSIWPYGPWALWALGVKRFAPYGPWAIWALWTLNCEPRGPWAVWVRGALSPKATWGPMYIRFWKHWALRAL